MINIKFKKLDENAVTPCYSTDGACGMDITAINVFYNPKYDYYEYHTGLAFEVPLEHMMMIAPRSSNRKTYAYMPNSIGWLDSDYRGELLVCYKLRDDISMFTKLRNRLCNLIAPTYSYYKHMDNAPYKVGERCAQIMVIQCERMNLELVDNLNETERGDGGFGSTGV